MVKTKIDLMNPKVDFVFKCIFGNEKQPEILISFLNGVFDLPYEKRIVKVEIENPHLKKEEIEDKYSILDIKATANDETKIDIEIQIANKYDMIPRTLYYLSKLIEGQLKEKDQYKKLMKSVTINILDFKILTENDRIHNSFVFKEKETNEVLTELAEIHFIELEKLRIKKDIDKNSLLNEWLMFIENPESEEIEMIAKKIPEIKEAKKTLEILSLDKKARMTYEQRQKALKDKISMLSGAKEEGIKEGIEKGIKEGIKEGMKQEKIIIAKNLLDVLDDKTISMKTGLSIKEVNELRR